MIVLIQLHLHLHIVIVLIQLQLHICITLWLVWLFQKQSIVSDKTLWCDKTLWFVWLFLIQVHLQTLWFVVSDTSTPSHSHHIVICTFTFAAIRQIKMCHNVMRVWRCTCSHSIRITVFDELPCLMNYHVWWITVFDESPCLMNYRVWWITVFDELPCLMNYRVWWITVLHLWTSAPSATR